MSNPAFIKRNDWNERVSLAEQTIPLLGQLRRNSDAMASVFGRRLESVIEIDIIKSYRYARRITSQELPPSQTLPILQELVKMDLDTVPISLGALATGFEEEGGDLRAFPERKLANVISAGTQAPKTDIVLYGFGYIDRLLVRILLTREALFNGSCLCAIMVRQNGENDVVKRTPLLRRNSVHGALDSTISVDRENNIIWADGTPVQVIYPNDPATVGYIAYDTNDAIVIDNTGRWRDREGLSQHLQSKGVTEVLLTVSGKGDMKNIVYGTNHNIIKDSDGTLPAASCTTNDITPVLKVVSDKQGVEFDHVETAHSFTDDQDLVDNFHKGSHRGCTTTLSMILTKTGAAKAVAKALLELEGKLTGNTIRVPAPDVPMAVLGLALDTEVDRDEINNYLREVFLKPVLRQRTDYIHSSEVISTDFVGSTHAGIVDDLATIANDKHLVLYIWYNNKFGHSNQVTRIIEEIAGARPRIHPEHGHIDEL